MLGTLRRHSQSAIIYFLFAIIIIVFVFTFNTGAGKGGGGCGASDVPVYAEMGSHEFTRDDLNMAMQLLPGFMSSPEGMALLWGMGIDLTALYSMNDEQLTPQQANLLLQMLQGIYLISDEAERLGFSVGKDEMRKALYPQRFYVEEDDPENEGEKKKVFNWKAYHSWVAFGLKTSQARYEDFTRRLLLSRKMLAFFSGLVQVTDAEIRFAALAKAHEVNLELVEFVPRNVEDQVEVPSDLAAFTTEKAEEISAYYDSHPAEFHVAPQAKIRVALAAAAEEAKRGQPKPKPDMAKALARATEMLERFNGTKPLLPEDKGEDKAAPKAPAERFKELAKHWSQHASSRDRSGMVEGWQTKTTLTGAPFGPKVAEAVLGADAGKVIGPVESETGYWLVFIEEAKKGRDLDLEAATPEIAATLYRKEHAEKKAAELAEGLLAKAKGTPDKSLEDVLKEAGDAYKKATFRRTGSFPLSNPGFSIPTAGKNQELFREAFSLTTKAPLASKIYKDEKTDRLFVVRLIEKKSPSEDGPDDDALAKARERLSGERDIAFFQAWYDSIRRQVEAEGDLVLTEEWSAYIAYLQTAMEEREEAEAMKKAKTKKK